MRGAKASGRSRLKIRGVLLDTNTKMDYESLLAYEKDRQKRGELAFQASISLSREEECFSALTADFLEAVAESGSMLGACQIRDISYSKGWKMLKIAEAQLGIQFLERQTGGSRRISVLTPEGKVFLGKIPPDGSSSAGGSRSSV